MSTFRVCFLPDGDLLKSLKVYIFMYYSLFILPLLTLTAFGATITSTVTIDRNNANKPIPRFVNGFTVFYDRDAQTITSYDRSGKLNTQAALKLPDVARITIIDVTADSAGRLVVAGSASDSSGQYGASVLIWLKPDGGVEKVVRPDAFAVRRVLFTPGGILLALGGVRDVNLRETSSHDMVREYGPDGRLLRTLAPWTTFSDSGRHPSADGFLAANQEMFGIYSRATETYAEYSSSGSLLGKWTIALPAETDITGVGLTRSGFFYLGGFASRTGAPVAYKLDRATGGLSPVDVPKDSQPVRIAGLLAAEDDSLIFYSRPTSIVKILP